MNEQELKLKLETERLLMSLSNYQELSRKNFARGDYLRQEIEKHKDNIETYDDYKYVASCVEELKHVVKMADTITGMIHSVRDDTRKLYVLQFGEAGGVMFDAIWKELEKEKAP